MNLLKTIGRIFKKIFCTDHVIVCILALFFAWLLAFISINFTIFNPLVRALDEFAMTDIYFAIQRFGGDVKWSDDIVLVDITKQYDRSEIAKTVDDISQCNPKTVLFDVIFERPGEDELANAELVGALEKIPEKVMSCKLVDYDKDNNLFKGCVKSFFSEFEDFDWGYSNVNKNINNGCLRGYTLWQKTETDTVYSLAYYTACKYRGKQPKAEKLNKRTIVYGNIEFPVVSCDSVLLNKTLLKNRIVMVGTMTEEADMHVTPIGKMAGLKTQAYAVQSCLDHPKVTSMTKVPAIIITLIVCMIAAWGGYFTRKYSPRFFIYWNKLLYLLIGAVFVWLGFLCFVRLDYDITMVMPLLGMAFIERARLHWMWFIDYCASHPQWKRLYRFASKSLYFKP